MFLRQKMMLSALMILSLFLVGCGNDSEKQKAVDHLSRSKAYMQQGQFRAATLEAQNTIKYDPDSVAGALQLADIYSHIGASPRAIEDLALLYKKDGARLLGLALANAYLKQGKFLSAQEILAQVNPVSDSERLDHQLYSAGSYLLEKKFGDALGSYREVLSESPDNTKARLGVINALIAQNKLDQAKNEVDDLLVSEARNPEALFSAGYIFYLVNDLEQSEAMLSEALFNLPETDLMTLQKQRVLRLLSRNLTEQGRTTEALVYSKLLRQANPEGHSAEQRLNDALAAMEAGNIEEAQQILEAILEVNPNIPQAALMLGVLRLQQGDVAAGAELLGDNLDVETANEGLIRTAAIAQLKSGKALEALQKLKRATEAHKDNIVLLSTHGAIALGIKGHEQEGVISLQRALALDSSLVSIRHALASYYLKKGQVEEALGQYRLAFEAKPDEWGVTARYLSLLLKLERKNEAVKVVGDIERAYPGNSNTLLYKALLASNSGDNDEAIKLLAPLANTAEDDGRISLMLGRLYAAENKQTAALTTLEALLKRSPDNFKALQAALAILSRTPNGSSIDWLDQLQNKGESLAPTAVGAKAFVYLNNQKSSEAMTLITSYKGRSNSIFERAKLETYTRVATQLAENEQWNKAKELISDVLLDYPDNRLLSILLVRLEAGAGNFVSANDLLNELQKDYVEDELVFERTRLIRMEKGDIAAHAYLSANWEDTYHQKFGALLFSLASNVDEAEADSAFNKWQATTSSKDLRPRIAIAQYHQVKGNAAKARVYYEELLQADNKNPIVLNNLAWLIKDEDLTTALSYAKAAADSAPNSASILDTYGWLLYLQGDVNEAKALLQRASELAPENKDIAEHLSSIKQK